MKMKLFLFAALFLDHLVGLVTPADLVIRIPGDPSKQDGFYRLDYRPPVGFPVANSTFKPSDISDTIDFSRGLPGTRYDFTLYYTNSTILDFPALKASIITAPDAPTNLSITVEDGEVATVNWDPPAVGQHSAFKLKLIPLSGTGKTVRNIVIRDTWNCTLRDLTPGATYEIQLYSIYEDKESQTYITTNFTTQPKAPSRFIVWFRNETTLLVLWQPSPYAGFYTDYKISIDSEDGHQSWTYVQEEDDIYDSPAQVALNGLVPGRAYNISVQTVSEDRLSEPTTSEPYRTVPLGPHNVTFNPDKIGPYSFEVEWEGPDGVSEFDRYTVSIGIRRKSQIERGQPLIAQFSEDLHPGQTYKVVVKSHSGSVASSPAIGNVTTRPLPVTKLQQATDNITGEISLTWEPNPDSSQDTYKVEYHEIETFNGDSSSVIVDMPAFSMSNLQPGRNYSITVKAISNGMESLGMTVFQATSNITSHEIV